MRSNPFFIDTFRELLNKYNREEISIGKLVEELNDTANEWRNSLLTPSADVQERAKEWDVNPATIMADLWDETDPMVRDCLQFNVYLIGGCEMFKYLKNNLAGHAGASSELEALKGALEHMEIDRNVHSRYLKEEKEKSEALKAENERLREALLDIANMTAGKEENGLVIYCNRRANKELNKPQQ